MSLRSNVGATAIGVVLLAGGPLRAGESGQGPLWPGYGGPNGDFSVAVDLVPWLDSGPRKLWDQPLGAGYSGIVADDRQLFTHYRDEDDEVVVALDPETGARTWEHRYRAPARRENLVQFGRGPHATPLLLADRVVTLGYAGDLRALDRVSGDLLWDHQLVEDFGGLVTRWGFSASPIEHDGLVVVLVGGPQGAMALDPENGAVRWKSEPGTVSYTTPRVLDVGSRQELVFFAKDALRSVDPRDGRTLWSHSVVNGYENHASNLLWDGAETLWVASQQDAAGRVLRLGESRPPEESWRNSRVRLHHWNAVLIENTVYGSLGDSTQIFSAVDLASGEILWRDRRFGLVNPVHTSQGTLLLGAEGELLLVRLSRDGVELLAQASIADERSWTAPTLVGSRLYVRDVARIRAFDLSRDP